MPNDYLIWYFDDDWGKYQDYPEEVWIDDAIVDDSWGVYAIFSQERNACKIGYSHRPKIRFRLLQTANPDQLRMRRLYLFRTRDTAKAFEATVHKSLISSRIRGEWFDATRLALEDLDHLFVLFKEKQST